MSDNPNGGQSRNSARESDDGKQDPQPPQCRESGLDDDKDDPSENDKRALRSTLNSNFDTFWVPEIARKIRKQQSQQQQQQRNPARKFEKAERPPVLWTSQDTDMEDDCIEDDDDDGALRSTPSENRTATLEEELKARSAHAGREFAQIIAAEPKASGAVDGARSLLSKDGEKVDHTHARQQAVHDSQHQVEGGQTLQQQQTTTEVHLDQKPANQVQHPHTPHSSPAESGRVGEVKCAVDPRVSSSRGEEEDKQK